ncbi:probable cytochrome P450 313a4 isoform X1 [Folsomia candida]|uniref:probable cytochrome P450 313a4 isoform X1 n=1 Tax=Folsomia candida TaxID=158441 RepID=UPI001604B416|nr:probable cytochrome P450 313a4 isoform X1 [Folsomia candida]
MWHLIALFFIAVIIWHVVYCNFSSKGWNINKFPGPTYIPLVGSMLVFGDMQNFFDHKKMRFPQGTSRIWLGFTPIIITTDCDVIQEILTSPACFDLADEVFTPLQHTVTEESIIISSNKDDKWKNQRKILSPGLSASMHPEFLTAFHTHLPNLMEVLEEKCKIGGEFNPDNLFGKFAMGVAFETILDCSVPLNFFQHDLALQYEMFVNGTYAAFQPALQPKFQIPLMWKFFGYGSEVQKLFDFMEIYFPKMFLKEKMSEWKGYEKNGALPKRMKYANLLYKKWTEEKLVTCQLSTILAATVDSTDSVLCVALIHLAKFKEVQTNAYLEARRVIGQDYDNALSIADIDKLKYIDMVIKESMRRITPTPVIARKVGKDLNLGNGLMIPKNTTVFIPLHLLHHNPEHYPDPDAFIPERFLPEHVEQRHHYAYQPFSSGPRNCIGKKYAMMELKFVLAKLLYKFEVTSTMKNMDDLNLEYTPFTKIRGDFRVGLRERRHT